MKYIALLGVAVLCGCGSSTPTSPLNTDVKGAVVSSEPTTIAAYSKLISAKTHCKDFESTIATIPDAKPLLKAIANLATPAKNEFETTKAFEDRSNKEYRFEFGEGVPYAISVPITASDLSYDADKSQLVINLISKDYLSKRMKIPIYSDTTTGPTVEESNAMGAKINVDSETGDQATVTFAEKTLGRHQLDNIDRVFLKMDGATAQKIKRAERAIIIGTPVSPYQRVEQTHHTATFTEPHESKITEHEFPIKLQCVMLVSGNDVVYDFMSPGN